MQNATEDVEIPQLDEILREGVLDKSARHRLNWLAVRSGILWGLVAASISGVLTGLYVPEESPWEIAISWFFLAGAVRF
jgi:hypothetical protein